jgi:hypothetical protein
MEKDGEETSPLLLPIAGIYNGDTICKEGNLMKTSRKIRNTNLAFAALECLAIIAAACGSGEAAVPTIDPPISTISATAPTEIASLPPLETVTAKPTVDPGLFSNYNEVYSPQDAAWVTINTSNDTVAAWNSKENKWDYRYEALAKDERINIFDANSFPDKFRDVAKNWLTATDEEWKMYQEFVEASRAEFFQKEGITDEVAAMTGINENLRSLWGVIDWTQHNVDQVIADKTMPVVTPSELRIILEDEPVFTSWAEKEKVNGQKKHFFMAFVVWEPETQIHLIAIVAKITVSFWEGKISRRLVGQFLGLMVATWRFSRVYFRTTQTP